MGERQLSETTSLCRTCKRPIDASIWRTADDRVVMRKECGEHGAQEALLSSNASWYEDIVAEPAALEPPLGDRRPVEHGCPLDCGACDAHEQRVHLPVIPVTSACNLDCPICYTHNRNNGAWHMSDGELVAILEHLRQAAPDQRIVNLTGGEPTQHPRFVELVELCQREGIHRVTVSTHGMHFLRNEPMLARLAELDARIILSFDSFEAEANRAMLGGSFLQGKLRVLALLEKYGVRTTLLPVLARGYNDHEVGAFVELALSKDFIRSVEFHPMTFTGQSGASFDRSARYTTYDALADLEAQTGGALRIGDFVSSPIAHSLCYIVTYLLRLDDGRWLPFPRFMDREDLRALLARGLYLEPDPHVERRLQDVTNRLWAGDIECDDAQAVLLALKGLIEDLFDPDLPPDKRLASAERRTKAIYVHTHMDEETFDTARIRQCPVGMPGPDGSNIPSCAYNVLYRERDARFVRAPKPSVSTLAPGELDRLTL